MFTSETIAAIATAPGPGAIGVVRVSGPTALDIARSVFRRRNFDPAHASSHRAVYGIAQDPISGERLDDCVLLIFRAPNSYTGEDSVELLCHGGPYLLRRVLAACLDAGARTAEPGEFTYRAFRNGRLDLAQAEAVADLIAARSDHALRAANRLMAGGLSEQIMPLRDDLHNAWATLEASIESDDENIEVDTQTVLRDLQQLAFRIEAMLSQASAGRSIRSGFTIAICGRPNVGKSTLFNALLRRRRALVADTPGTTRDTIDETTEIGGIAVTLVDTAGLRTPRSRVERDGVQMARDAADTSDGVLMVADIRRKPTEAEFTFAHQLGGRCIAWILNKADAASPSMIERSLARVRASHPNAPTIVASAASGLGLDRIEDAVAHHAIGPNVNPDAVVVTHERHVRALSDALRHMRDAIRAIRSGEPLDATAQDLREAGDALASIIGLTLQEDVIVRLFSRFCMGK